MALESSAQQPSAVGDPRDRDLQTRIRVEFKEMPGLKLTLPQASRLFHVEATTCARALSRLVAAGALSYDEGTFVRGGVRVRGDRRR
jgi:hypothetical protein